MDEEPRMPAPEPRIYAYGIVQLHDDSDEHGLPAIDGVGGEPVRALSRDGIAALVSELPVTDGGMEDAWHDVERVKLMVLDHHRVLQAVVDRCAVLPLRFGTVFGSDAGVEAALAAHRQGLREALARVEGAREWGMKLFCDRAALHSDLTAGSEIVCAARSRIAAATQGRGYFLNRQLEQTVADEAEQAIDRCIADVRQSLLATARAEAVLKPQPAAVHGSTREMVWNGAFLVATADEDRFFECIAALKRSHGQSGFTFECTGPWPASSFVECHLE
jgi:hypothetical protein